MEARQLDNLTSTVTVGDCDNIGIQDIRKTYHQIRKAGRFPVFHVHPLLQEGVFHGELVDWILKHIRPGYDPKIHKGFLIPEKYSDLVKELFG
jgi:hypothetical protein